MLFFVLPRFNQMFVQLGVETPVTTRLLLSTGQWLVEYWYVAVGLATALVSVLFLLFTSAVGRQWLSDVQVGIPVLGRIRARLIQGQVFRTMGTLLEAGVGVLDSLDLARTSTRNKRFQAMFDDLENTVTSGGQLNTAFERSGLVEPFICQAIHTGEEGGNPGGAMTYCADMLDEMNTELIEVFMRLIEPVILIGMGLVVGAVAISLFLPLFDMTSALR
jgi:type II secretory pathway component PulF